MSTILGIPRVPLLLGLLGLVPFATGVVLAFFGIQQLFGLPIDTMLMIYSVTILSFLGGVRWGIALGSEDTRRRDPALVLAVIPSLIGWVVTMFPVDTALVVLAIAFAVFGLLDVLLDAPGWYRRLRILLSILVVAMLVLASMLMR